MKEEQLGEASIFSRTIKYQFDENFLNYKTLSLKLVINVISEEPIENLTLIERFYFKDRLIRNFEFKFPFCLPKSQNECEFIYDVPALTDEEKKEMIEYPWEAQSDSFFFVGERLIIHNKAAYSYQ